MKLNQRIYDYAVEDKLIERQELRDGKSIEIYSLNEYQDIYTEFTNQGKFAVWSCVDNQNYRLYIEDGYYKKLEPLYKQRINQIWIDFWDECDKAVSKFRNIVMPIMLVAILVFFIGGSILIKNQTIQLIVALVVAFVFIVFIFTFRKVINKRISNANQVAVSKIKDILGEKRFEKLLEEQRSYIDTFFKYDEQEETEETQVEEVEPANDQLENTEVIDVEEVSDENKNDEKSE